MLVEDASTAVPLLHSSGMYLRWDPTDSATAEQGKRAWTELMENHAKLPIMDPATGTSRPVSVHVVHRRCAWICAKELQQIDASLEVRSAYKLGSNTRVPRASG